MKKTAFFLLIVTLFFRGFLTAGESETSDGPSADLLYGRGVEFFFADRYAEAADLFQQASAIDAENPAYLYFLGLCHFREGDPDEARLRFTQGAEAEFTPRGGLVYVPGHLRKIQGNERVLIEQIRQDVGRARQEKERRRQIALYGDLVDRHRRRLCGELTSNLSSDLSFERSGATVSTPSSPSSADPLPVVPPIRPLTRPEIDGSISPVLAQYGVDEIIQLRDEYAMDQFGNVLKDENGQPILKTSLSTAEQKRIALKEKKEKERAEAEEKFVDIFSDDEVSSDNTAFGGESQDAGMSGSGASAKPRGTARDRVLSSIFGDSGDASDETEEEAPQENVTDEEIGPDSEEE